MVVPHYLSDDYKDHQQDAVVLAPVLLQYRFITPITAHELLILNEKGGQFYVHIDGTDEAKAGYIVNLPANHQYAIASLFLYMDKIKKELVLEKKLPLFNIDPNTLTRIRGFNIINDPDPRTDAITIVPWDKENEKIATHLAAQKYHVPEKSIKTINIFQ